MKKMIICALLCTALALPFAACSNSEGAGSTGAAQATESAATDENVDLTNLSDGEYDLSFSNRDLDASYDRSASPTIDFAPTSVTCTSQDASVSGTTVTIKNEGTYIISGSCDDGKIVVEADEKAKIQLVLNGLTLGSTEAPIVVKSADKVFITLADGTENTVFDGALYSETIDDTSVDAAVFSKEDLTINGAGKLTVNGNFKHGIVSKDDLVIAGGELKVTSQSTAIEGKDSVKLTNASVTVDAGSDAIRSTNIEETSEKGFVYIHSGTLNLTAGNDAVQAASLLRVDGGEITISTGGGSTNGKVHTENNFRMDMFSSNSDSEDSDSAKGLKSADVIRINGGSVTADTSDDSLHSGGATEINGGTLTLSTGDDGVHADSSVTINGGTVKVEKSYEGIEAGEITVNDGTISVTATDDGFNAAGGNDGNSGMDPFSGDSSKKLTFNGGYTYVDAQGDGIDSNGDILITGGTILVNGPDNGGNGAIDSGTSATITGGTIIAIGSTGMAETVEGNGQCSIQADISSQQGGTTAALVDSAGNVIASLTSSKAFSNVVVSSPSIKAGETYSVICGGTAEKADSNGFASSGTISGGSTVAQLTLDSENYSNGGNTMGGGFGGGMRGGDMNGFGGIGMRR